MPLQYSSRECAEPAALGLSNICALVWAVPHVRACGYGTVTCYSSVTGVTGANGACGGALSLHIVFWLLEGNFRPGRRSDCDMCFNCRQLLLALAGVMSYVGIAAWRASATTVMFPARPP